MRFDARGRPHGIAGGGGVRDDLCRTPLRRNPIKADGFPTRARTITVMTRARLHVPRERRSSAPLRSATAPKTRVKHVSNQFQLNRTVLGRDATDGPRLGTSVPEFEVERTVPGLPESRTIFAFFFRTRHSYFRERHRFTRRPAVSPCPWAFTVVRRSQDVSLYARINATSWPERRRTRPLWWNGTEPNPKNNGVRFSSVCYIY